MRRTNKREHGRDRSQHRAPAKAGMASRPATVVVPEHGGWLMDFTHVLAEARARQADWLRDAEPIDPEIEAQMREDFAALGERLAEMVANDEPDRALTLEEIRARRRPHLRVIRGGGS